VGDFVASVPASPGEGRSPHVDAEVEETTVEFAARDGYPLVGTLVGSLASAWTIGLFACGGGIPAQRYRHFLRGLASFGLPMFVFDYRGIGQSRPPGTLRGLRARAEDWAEFDCGGALDWLSAHFPYATLVGVTHSFGSMILTATPGAERLAAIAMIGPHTGYWGDYRPMYRAPMTLMWHVCMPIATSVCGYFPGRRLRLGDDLPKGFALQWAGRLTPGFRDRPHSRGAALMRQRLRLSSPLLVVAIRGDAFATPEGIDRVLRGMPEARVSRWNVDVRAAQKRRLGHFGFFRRACRDTLWSELLARILPLAEEQRATSRRS